MKVKLAPRDSFPSLIVSRSDDGNARSSVLPHHLFVLAAAKISKETGLYPLTGMENTKAKKETRQQLNLSRPKSPEDVQNSSQGSEEEELKEVRQIIQMNCTIKEDDGSGKILNLLLKFEDRMNRQLKRKITSNESSLALATDLVHHGLISEVDLQNVASKIEESLKAPA